mgnify:CR=1 FL=1
MIIYCLIAAALVNMLVQSGCYMPPAQAPVAAKSVPAQHARAVTIARVCPAMAPESVYVSRGSGVAVATGQVLTAHHVTICPDGSAPQMAVTGPDDVSRPAALAARSPAYDIARLSVPGLVTTLTMV